MKETYIQDRQFESIDFSVTGLGEEYENCSFTNCNFSNSNLSGIIFTECKFTGCNLSMASLAKTTFGDTAFIDCKLLGLHFEDCNQFLFTVSFDNCVLNLSSFYKLKVKNTTFKNSTLHEVDLTETDLSNAIFDNCDLRGVVFEHTILEKADFRTSYNYSINPELNKIKKAKFSMPGVIRLLDKYDIEID
jgi:uncharacterized protein YjbI with pentapeptide repeats